MARMHHRAILLSPLVLLSLLLLSGLAAPIFATTPNGTSGSDGTVVVSLPATGLVTDAVYDNACPGALAGCSGVPSGSWSNDIFSVTGTGSITVTVTDCCYVADYYSLWMTTDPSGLTGWTLVGTTPSVETDSNLAAPTYNSQWDGGGTTLSTGSFTTSVSGTTLFAVRDELFDPMVTALVSACSETGDELLSLGCGVSGITVNPNFSPAEVHLDFSAITVGTPQFPMGMALLLAMAIPLLFLTRSRFRLTR